MNRKKILKLCTLFCFEQINILFSLNYNQLEFSSSQQNKAASITDKGVK